MEDDTCPTGVNSGYDTDSSGPETTGRTSRGPGRREGYPVDLKNKRGPELQRDWRPRSPARPTCRFPVSSGVYNSLRHMNPSITVDGVLTSTGKTLETVRQLRIVMGIGPERRDTTNEVKRARLQVYGQTILSKRLGSTATRLFEMTVCSHLPI